MKASILITILFLSIKSYGQNLYFPPQVTNVWDTISPIDLDWCTDQIDDLYEYLDNSNTKAFIVLKDGKIAIEKYFGTFTQDSIWYWASAGKTITAFAIGKAQEEGFLSIQDTTSQYLGQGWTSLTPQQEEKITIYHQLSQTAGLDDQVPNSHCTLPSCLQYIADPGDRWAYHNGSYTLLKDILAIATGYNINTFLIPRLKLPTGITGNFFQLGDDYVFLSKARSMARFGLLMLNNGNWNGNQLMQDNVYFNEMITPSQNLNESYGYLWWLNGQPSLMLPGLQIVFPSLLLPSAPSDVYAALGKNGQIINVSPSNNLVLIRMGNNPDNSLVPNLYNDTIWQKLNTVICQPTEIDIHDFKKATIYPNPSKEFINIKNIEPGSLIQLYSLSGQTIQTTLATDSIIKIEYSRVLKPGIYFLKISHNGIENFQKIIVE